MTTSSACDLYSTSTGRAISRPGTRRWRSCCARPSVLPSLFCTAVTVSEVLCFGCWRHSFFSLWLSTRRFRYTRIFGSRRAARRRPAGLSYFTWIGPAMLVVAIVALPFVGFVRRLDRRTAVWKWLPAAPSMSLGRFGSKNSITSAKRPFCIQKGLISSIC